MQFYYHPDHLGSSSYITNLDGEVVQHIEYVPFGEVFIEERNNIWNTPYLFNAKEFDEETGLYYYGARYYDPRVSLLTTTANTVAQESSGNKIESFALASAIKNLADYKGKSIMQTIQTEGIFGYRDGGNNTQYNNNAEYSMAAVLNAITGGKDFQLVL